MCNVKAALNYHGTGKCVALLCLLLHTKRGGKKILVHKGNTIKKGWETMYDFVTMLLLRFGESIQQN
jgi:hypothetical protein